MTIWTDQDQREHALAIKCADAEDKADRLSKINADLLAAIEWMHPSPGKWRLPHDDKAADIDRIIAIAKGQTP